MVHDREQGVPDEHTPTSSGPVLTAAEAAALLRIPYKTLIHLAADGVVPAARLGKHWRFSRQALLDHLGSTAIREIDLTADGPSETRTLSTPAADSRDPPLRVRLT